MAGVAVAGVGLTMASTTFSSPTRSGWNQGWATRRTRRRGLISSLVHITCRPLSPAQLPVCTAVVCHSCRPAVVIAVVPVVLSPKPWADITAYHLERTEVKLPPNTLKGLKLSRLGN